MSEPPENIEQQIAELEAELAAATSNAVKRDLTDSQHRRSEVKSIPPLSVETNRQCGGDICVPTLFVHTSAAHKTHQF
jgi:hypothetical protein